ncbi:bifunctional tRNA (adenosine(37)-C2)-methyltransferase TrmG/ribosomal RNA large subunit methyltransferase RlmN [Candidatus Vesicomyidisocius calyptogenae]|uniref:Dual-specificity RNA methyltransferase RlmN n=1 Tax=Vesicomyosocius okutanii subsp. Calyptogena okutanii (strain HA) TaxID=412965 RepID=RLMN_VESOH|nr:bifunctional tRNA (adenosine(37)-C2)-methyltransferase TrmG/ribosomal RNA large subunit methyltransferase RlmN [Candidatus Vesicomyosocius okutanii]A5CX33.1 RecName: Full=Dual-specificity RNA methyltransferase RlmN; AltName: Full=23S rRNA (adenine(2503)-C(2))-methyltransferase; AltName: Full=23S rRNA m2A2503 methyltransferase; AltName: Full=Ribosomal RNA large subunit methyltransferase N; AltName: Full=tRNA (adenine(37)-C(2))-methyltransferase; AltName: Full=tRNA m2A37 methyltransferase [Candid
MNKQNLLSLNQDALNDFFVCLGEKHYRTKQIMQWIYKVHEFDFDKMFNFSKSLREELNKIACIEFPKVVKQKFALDKVIKWVLALSEDNYIEMVYIPEKDRGTLCISSQVGCALACTFCSTGMQGFNKNLTTAEIIAQVLIANKYLNSKTKRISNIVFMGMGEPLLNEQAVYNACDLLLDDLAFGLSRRKVTISTSGIVPSILRMSKRTPVSLAISLHAPNNQLRDKLVPVNQKYSIEELLKACKVYLNAGTQERHILFEYVMLKDVNDSTEHANKLAKLLKAISAKVNLIPFNSFERTQYQSSNAQTIEKFQDILYQQGIRTMMRRTRGEDIDGACGQLAGKVLNKTKKLNARKH